MDRDDWGTGASIAADMHKQGADLDAIAKRLTAEGLGPILTYKALRAATGADYITAKSAMHRNLPDSFQGAAERLWDAVEEALDDRGSETLPPASHDDADPTEPR